MWESTLDEHVMDIHREDKLPPADAQVEEELEAVMKFIAYVEKHERECDFCEGTISEYCPKVRRDLDFPPMAEPAGGGGLE